MRELAEALLPPGHALRFEAIRFATSYELHHRDPVALNALGEALDRGVSRLLRPDAVDLSRRDIHG